MSEETEPRALNRALLARQLLLERVALPVPDAIARLGALQAQEPRPPFVGLWTRLAGFAAEDLRTALVGGDVVRATWVRGTLHLVTPGDYLALRTTLQDALVAGAQSIARQRGGEADVGAVTVAAREVLADGPRTFDEIRAGLLERLPDVEERTLGYVARMAVPLVMVPGEERWAFPRDVPFALAASRLGREPDREVRAAELVRRCLAAYGPMTVADLQTWTGVKPLKDVVAGIRDELVAFRAGRRELLDLPDAPRPGPDADAPARFLPEFDGVLLAHADRTRIIADEHRPAVFTRNLRVRATFLVDGVVAGTWSAQRKRGVATVRLAPFGRLARADRAALEAEADGLVGLLEPEADDVAVVVER